MDNQNNIRISIDDDGKIFIFSKDRECSDFMKERWIVNIISDDEAREIVEILNKHLQ